MAPQRGPRRADVMSPANDCSRSLQSISPFPPAASGGTLRHSSECLSCPATNSLFLLFTLTGPKKVGFSSSGVLTSGR